MLGVLTQDQLATRCSRSATPRSPRSARRPRAAASPSPPSRTATTSASSATATPVGWLAREAGRRAPRTRLDRRPATARCSGRTRVATASPSASAGACASGARPPDGQPRYVLDIEPVSGTVTVGPREALAVDASDRDPAARGAAPRRPSAGVHGAAARPRRRAPGGRDHRSPADEARSRSPARPRHGHRARTGGGRLRRHARRRARATIAATRGRMTLARASARCRRGWATRTARATPRPCASSSASCPRCRTFPSFPGAAPSRT